jgi:DNA-binding transcriptional LysR family regulator
MNMASSDEMVAFARIVDNGSFAKAAQDLRVTPSALSKLVSRLEDRLGARLLTRTTRRLALTPEGEIYLARAREVLALIESAEADVSSSRASPRGLLRINTGTAVAKRLVETAIADFLSKYPGVSVELDVADRIVDPVAENVDVALRTGPVAHSALVIRKLADFSRIICAAPSYLEKHGTPGIPADLHRHNCLTLSGRNSLNAWPFAAGEGINRLQVSGNFSSDSVSMLLEMALQGQGIVRLANFVLARPIREGLLIPLLTDTHMSEPVPLWAVMPPGRHRAPRVQAFIDFIADRLKVE